MHIPSKTILTFLGIEFNFSNQNEKIISAIGSFIGMLLVMGISGYLIGFEGSTFLVASIGASAVLLFAVPHGPLSQPWPLVGGHVISAMIGVSCYKFIPFLFLAAPLSVALALAAMYYLRCIHPPGGATALTAVIGGNSIHALGYLYVIIPILLNVVIIFVTAVFINYWFPWRRYPVTLAQQKKSGVSTHSPISLNDLTYALRQMGSFIDVTEDDLEKIYALAMQHAQRERPDPLQLKVSHHYSNGRYAEQWAVRQVVSVSARTGSDEITVTYKVVAGKGRRTTATCSLEEFTQWAESEVFLNENSWQRTPVQNISK